MASIPEYWCDESLVVTINGPHGHSTTTIDKPYARIGSHARSEIRLSGPGVDPRSLYLHATREGVYCVRVQATEGGTLGDGFWLKADERLQVGPFEISARLPREVAEPPPRIGLTAWRSAVPPLPVCEISSDGKVRDKRRFRARLNLVGRRRELALQMLGQQVSSCHCALFWDSGRLWCIDLLSSNGTLLNGQLIDCAPLEMGNSLIIGEFSLQFKRLSRSTPRQSSWRTGDSDDDLSAAHPAGPQDEAPADLLAQTASVATGDTGKAVPGPAENLPAPNLESEVSPENHMILPSRAELRPDQQQLQEEFSRRSRRLIEQRQQLDQAWQRANEEVAAQVSFLQSESALLAAQRQEMARLRAEFEMQRRSLTEDLLALQQQQLPQPQGPLDPRPHPALGNQSTASQEFNLVVHRPLGEENVPAADHFTEQSDPAGGQAAVDASRYSPANPSTAKTIIEGSYVVEKQTPETWLSQRSTFPSRSHSGSPAATEQRLSLPSSGDGPSRAIASPAAIASDAAASDSSSPRVIGPKTRIEPDQLGAYVADRLTHGNATHRFWLRVLWGVAAIASLTALAALGYVVLRSQ